MFNSDIEMKKEIPSYLSSIYILWTTPLYIMIFANTRIYIYDV